jgi:hypothetical protein
MFECVHTARCAGNRFIAALVLVNTVLTPVVCCACVTALLLSTD